MENFIHHIPTQLYFGKGQIEHLPEILNRYGKRVLLVYGGGSIKRNGLYDTIINMLDNNGFIITECSGVEPNPRIESVARGAELCKEKHIDVLLAVGGGSTIDAAKAMAVGAKIEGNDYWNMAVHSASGRPALPLVDVLTLSATGSEFDSGAVISNMKTNEKLGGTYTFPAVSICDPTYTFTVPAYQTAAGAADIMSHIMEGYFSRDMDCEVSDGLSEAILRSVVHNAPIAIKEPENYSARANLMYCSSLACSEMPEYGKSGTGWPCHGMEHELSAYYDITHGVGLAILTPRWMRFILKKDPSIRPRFLCFARNVFGLNDENEEALAQAGIDALENFFLSLQLPMHLAQLNIDETHFMDMAKHVNRNGRMEHSVVPLSNEEVVEILKACL